VLESTLTSILNDVRDASLGGPIRLALAALNHALSWLKEVQTKGDAAVEAGARRFALTVGRAMELALLIRHAQWSIDHENDTRTAAAAHRFAHSVIDLVVDDFSK
jgi:hypothetical protein